MATVIFLKRLVGITSGEDGRTVGVLREDAMRDAMGKKSESCPGQTLTTMSTAARAVSIAALIPYRFVESIGSSEVRPMASSVGLRVSEVAPTAEEVALQAMSRWAVPQCNVLVILTVFKDIEEAADQLEDVTG